MSFLTLDIETVPQARFLDPEHWCWRTGNGIEPAKDWELEGEPWEAWTDEATHDVGGLDLEVREARVPLKATGVSPSLHATTCHIVQVSFGWRRNGEIETSVLQSDAYGDPSENRVVAAEATLVADALGRIAAAMAKGTRLVSFNAKSFDIPVLRARAALLRLNRAPINWRRLLYPYSDDQHADLRLILGADDRRARGTLQWWADAFGIHAEEHGADVFSWVEDGEWEKLRAYGECEARTLVELFEAVGPVL